VSRPPLPRAGKRLNPQRRCAYSAERGLATLARGLSHAAATWHQLTGEWDSRTLAWLHRENVHASPGDLDAWLPRIFRPRA
jgi:hypothetical protein